MTSPAQIDIVSDQVEDARDAGRPDPHRRQAQGRAPATGTSRP